MSKIIQVRMLQDVRLPGTNATFAAGNVYNARRATEKRDSAYWVSDGNGHSTILPEGAQMEVLRDDTTDAFGATRADRSKLRAQGLTWYD